MDRILEQVQSGDFDPVAMFTGNKDKLLEVKSAIETISKDLAKETCMEFLLTKIIPSIFDKSIDNTIRDKTVEIGLHLLKFTNVSDLDANNQENIFTSIEETYAKTIGELRDNNYCNWDKLWIFLIRLCHKKIHTRMSLANKLLRVVEVAFRNSISVEQRLKAYDCWAELIDNSSLSMDHMCSARQIKLLMTPMKAKFSRMPVVIMKRCDTFVYLLEKLQDRGTLCLKEFLEFCFGPFNESDAEKTRQGRSVPDVCIKSTKVFMELIGHSHSEVETCLQSDAIQLQKPLIGKENFPSFAEILISSTVECCVLLDEWNKESSNINTIIKCLWRTLLQLIQDSNDETKKKCCTQINNSLGKILERAEFNLHLNVLLGNVVELLIQDEMENHLKEILFDICMNLLQNCPISCHFNEEILVHFVNSCFGVEVASRFDRMASSYFKSDAKSTSSSLMCEIWIKCNFTASSGNISYLIWPIRHLQHFNDIKSFQSKWTKLYNTECKSEIVKASLLQELEKLFLGNPLLSSNIITFLQLISATEYNSSKDFVARFMRLIEVVLTLPNLSEIDIRKISSMVLSYCNQNQSFYSSDNNDEALDKMCGCLEHLITIHKDYNILIDLVSCLNEGMPRYLPKFSKRLLPVLEAIILNEENSVTSATRQLIKLLETKENENETVALTSTRSSRLVNLANRTLKGSKDGKTLSPLIVRSSPRVKRRVKDSKKKIDATVSINDDKSSDYVKINTEIKLSFDNLNEHQKEMLKRRREDIPALYEDLTQSQSKDIFDNAANNDLKENSLANCETIHKDKGVGKKRKRDTILDETSYLSSKLVKRDIFINTVEETEKTSNTNNEEKDLQRDEIKTRKSSVINLNLTETYGEEIKTDTEDLPETVEPNNQESIEEIMDKSESEINQTESKIEKEQTVEITEPLAQNNLSHKSANKGQKESRRKSVRLGNKSRGTLDRHGLSVESKINQQLLNLNETIETRIDGNSAIGIEGDPHGNEKFDVLTDAQEAKETDDIKKENANDKNFGEASLRKSQRQINKRGSVVQNKESSKSPENRKTDRKHISIRANQEDEDMKKIIQKLVRKSKKQLNRQENEEEALAADKGVTSEASTEDLLSKVNNTIMEAGTTKIKETEGQEALQSNIITSQFTWEDGNQNKIDLLHVSRDKAIKAADIVRKPARNIRRVLSLKKRSFKNAMKSSSTAKTQDSQAPTSTQLNDVYEFTGDTEVTSVEERKKKRDKRRLCFNTRDYISKRRKKAKKNNKERLFPFHITADSADCSTPVPLSESPSLRAVPSPESETITIVITRSPPVPDSVPKEGDDNVVIINETTPPKRRTRSNTPVFDDVIESSQTCIELNKRKSSSPKKSRAAQFVEEKNSARDLQVHGKKENLLDTKTLPTESSQVPENNTTVTPVPRVLKIVRRLSLTEVPTQKIKLAKRKERSKSLDKMDFVVPEFRVVLGTSSSELSPKKPLLPLDTSTGAELGDAETLTLTPVVDDVKEDLPSSPVTCETPNRTLELLNNTSDISPINNLIQEELHTPTRRPSTNEVTNRRAAKVLQMVNPDVQVTNRKWFGNRQSSTGGRKERRVTIRKEEKLDILTFSREVPSPLIVPATGILKRRLDNLDEVVMPSPKRKRVNFSDPAITAKKIYIKDTSEYETVDVDEKSLNSEISDDLTDVLGGLTDKETNSDKNSDVREARILDIKKLCDANLKVTSVNCTNVKSTLKLLLQNLRVAEVTEIISEYLKQLDSSEVTSPVDDAVYQIVEKCVIFDVFSSKLHNVLEKLSNDELQHFIDEFGRIFEPHLENNIVKCELTEEQIESYIVNKFDCDKMNGLIKKYLLNMVESKRNSFLVDLICLCSSELPVTKEFISCHMNILQNFIKKMPD